MGLTHRNIIIFGHKLDIDLYDELGGYEEFKSFFDENAEEDDLVVFFDGRSEEYFYVGYLVKRTDSSRKGRVAFTQPIELKREEYQGRSEIDSFLEDYGIEVESPPNFHVFTEFR